MQIEIILKRMGAKPYEVLRKTSSIDPDTGADVVQYSPYKEILAFIQPTGSQGDVKGVQLKSTPGGDSVTADLFMYHAQNLEIHDRVVFKENLYEIRDTEEWESSFIKYNKSYLVKV